MLSSSRYGHNVVKLPTIRKLRQKRKRLLVPTLEPYKSFPFRSVSGYAEALEPTSFKLTSELDLYYFPKGSYVRHNLNLHTMYSFVYSASRLEALMSIVLNVHPGVQLDTRVDSKKVFAVRSWKGPGCI